jgi:hypothetical protein
LFANIWQACNKFCKLDHTLKLNILRSEMFNRSITVRNVC